MLKSFIVSLLLFFSFFKAQAFYQDSTKNKIAAVEVKNSNPLMGESFYRIFYVDDFVIYQNQYHYSESEVRLKFDSLNNDYNAEDTMMVSELRDYFFVYHKDSSYGYRYDPKNMNDNNKRLSVDSALQNTESTNNFETFLEEEPDSSIWNTDKTELKELYIIPKTQESPAVTFIFSYSKNLNHLKQSLNIKIDSIKRMKLYKVEILMDEFYSEKDKKHWPKSSFVEEIKEYKVQDPQEILQYINQYKTSIANK